MKGKGRAIGILLALCTVSVALFAGGAKEPVVDQAGSAAFNATGLPIVDDQVVLRFTGMNMNNTRVGRYDETDMMKQLESETNVKIVWDMIPQANWKERKNLLIASRELPDGFMGPLSLTAEEAQMLGADGVLIPLDGLIEEYAPNIDRMIRENPTYEASVRSTDGNIYALTAMQDMGFDSLSVSIIRQDWLDALGLEMPATTEEFYRVLRAFKDNDMAGNGKTIPFSFLYQESAAINREVKREFEWIFLAFGVPDNPTHVAIEDDGQLIFTADKPGFRDAISYLHRLYAEGLIDPEIFTQDRTLLTNKIRQLNVGCYTDYRLKSSMAHEEIQDKFSIMPPLEGPSGRRRWLRAMAGMSEGAFALTSSCKSPEVAIRWLEYVNEPENSIQMLYGMFKPEGWSGSEALVPSSSQLGKWTGNTDLRPSEVAPNDWPWSAPIGSSPVIVPRDVINRYIADRPNNVAKEEACAVYRPYLTKYPYNWPYRFTPREIEELSLLQTDLLNYIYRTQAKWIAEGGVEKDWDAYLAQLKKLHVEDYVQLYRAAYERSAQQ
ncbi:MAG: hypothetical protein WCR05_07590 [Sphaerochaetaceae bacterium]|jgi:putative aldouronate transport system substrate-binding protein